MVGTALSELSEHLPLKRGKLAFDEEVSNLGLDPNVTHINRLVGTNAFEKQIKVNAVGP